MNRREMLQRIGGLAGVAAVPSPLTPPSGDSFWYGSYRVTWRGWQQALNQHITLGYWHAAEETQCVDPNDPKQYIACTLGTCTRYRDLNVFPLGLTREERSFRAWTSPDEGAKARARARLLRCIDTDVETWS